MRVNFATKLLTGFAVVLVLVVVPSLLSVWRFARAADQRESGNRRLHEAVLHVERARAAEASATAAGRGFLVTRDPEFLERRQEAQAQLRAAIDQLSSRVDTPKGQQLTETVIQALGGLQQLQDERIALAKAGANLEKLHPTEDEAYQARSDFASALDALLTYKEERLAEGLNEAKEFARGGLWISLMVIVFALLAGALFAVLLSQHLTDAYERERRAVAARDGLMGAVAHDLRVPLSAITLKAALVRRTAVDEHSRRNAGSIQSVATRMEYMIRTLLDTASAEAGRLKIFPEPVRVEDALHEVVDTFELIAGSSSVRLTTEIQTPNLGVRADRDRLLEVLVNLVDNALKFSPEGGTVVLQAAQAGDEVRFSVIDQGPGIASEDLPRLFERHWSASTGKKGSGLGLYIVKQIIEAHRGRIWGESRVGHGAAFHFTLPRAQLPAHEPAPSQPPPRLA